MARKPAIPEVRASDPYDYQFLKSLKETLNMITGVTEGQIAPLSTTATNAQIIAKINELIARVNFG